MNESLELLQVGINVDIIREALPPVWTHVENVDWLKLGFALKLAGVDWKSLPEAMAYLENNKLIQRNGYTFRRTP